MPSLIDLRRRIRAVKSTQQITKAMKMIAASRLKRAQDRVVAARPFAQRMLRVLNGLVSSIEQDAHPLLRAPQEGSGRTLLIVITADRGLCGSFNSNVLKAAGTSSSSLMESIHRVLRPAGPKRSNNWPPPALRFTSSVTQNWSGKKGRVELPVYQPDKWRQRKIP